MKMFYWSQLIENMSDYEMNINIYIENTNLAKFLMYKIGFEYDNYSGFNSFVTINQVHSNNIGGLKNQYKTLAFYIVCFASFAFLYELIAEVNTCFNTATAHRNFKRLFITSLFNLFLLIWCILFLYGVSDIGSTQNFVNVTVE